jgi:hypothetical protein
MQKQKIQIVYGTYAAIRKLTDEGREYIDISSISCDRLDSEDKAEALDELIPQWASANPVQRIAKIEIKEITE